MEFSKIYNYKRPIHHMILAGEFFAAVDNETNLVFYDRTKEKLGAIQKFNSPLPHPHHRASGSSINGRLLVLYFQKLKSTYLLVYNTQKSKYIVAKQLHWSNSELECTVFDNQNHLFATGDNDGKVYVYSCKNGRLYNALPGRSDYIAAMAFNKDGNLLAYSSYDKSLIIYDLHRNKVLYSGTGQTDGVIITIKFLHEKNRIVLGDRNGKVTLYDFLKKRSLRTLAQCSAWPMSLYVEENDRYVLIADKKGHIHLADLENEQRESEVIHSSPYAVLDIRLFGKGLYFVFENGEMKEISLHDEKAEMQSAFAAGEYKKCYAMIEADPLLYHTTTRKQLDERFEELLKEAMTLIIAGKLNDAKQMLKPFESDERHLMRIQFNIKFAKKIFDFAQLIAQGQLDKAYRVAESDEKYRELAIYEKLERDFSEAFDRATYLLTAKTPDIAAARKVMESYANVPIKGGVVKNLFAKPGVFNKARLLFKQKEYGILGKFFEKYPITKEAPVYKEYQDFAANLEFFFEMHMELQEFQEALEIALIVEKHFPKILLRMQEEINRLKVTMAFITAVAEKSFLVALGLVSRNEFLIELPEYRKLDRYLNKRFEEALAYGQGGNFESMHKMLLLFLKNKNLQPRAMAIYKIFYIEQLNREKNDLDDTAWQRAFTAYVRCFGKDDEITLIARNSDKEALLKQTEKGADETFNPECIKKVIYEEE